MRTAPILLALLGAAVLLMGRSTSAASDKVQVYILMGQSNMLGEGKIGPDNVNGSLGFAVKTEGKYPYLWDKQANNWTTRNDVRYTFIMGSGNQSFEAAKLEHNEWMTVTGKTIGPELGMGYYLGNYTKGKVLILKACIGNRALGWDLLPPGTERSSFTDSKGQAWTYAGYHDSAEKWEQGTPAPTGGKWIAGEQYDGDTNRTAIVLKNLTNYYPGETEFEIAGFMWWQGDRDHYDDGLSAHYETNLVKLIKTLRTQFNAPTAKFVTASLGQTPMGATDNGGKILQAMLNVADPKKYPEFKGNVAAVYTHPLSMGGSSSAHYNGNAETYMNVGQAMGDAMIGLLEGDKKH